MHGLVAACCSLLLLLLYTDAARFSGGRSRGDSQSSQQSSTGGYGLTQAQDMISRLQVSERRQRADTAVNIVLKKNSYVNAKPIARVVNPLPPSARAGGAAAGSEKGRGA